MEIDVHSLNSPALLSIVDLSKRRMTLSLMYKR